MSGRRAASGRRACSRRGAACPYASAAARRPGARPVPPPSRGTSSRPAAISPPPRCPAAPLAACVEDKCLRPRPAGLSGGLYQRLIVHQAAASSGQPLPISRLGRAGRSHRPFFSHIAGRLKASEAGSCTCSHRCGRRFCIFLGVSAVSLWPSSASSSADSASCTTQTPACLTAAAAAPSVSEAAGRTGRRVAKGTGGSGGGCGRRRQYSQTATAVEVAPTARRAASRAVGGMSWPGGSKRGAGAVFTVG